jgi:methanesulfonate monooxygenase large subunit
MSKSAKEWIQTPQFPNSHFVDTRIYTDESLFKEEQEKIFNKSWIIACHESELPECSFGRYSIDEN